MKKSTQENKSKKIKATAINKIRRIEKELKKNPNNKIAKQSLDKWRKLL